MDDVRVRGYRFDPLDRRGLVLGLDGPALATVAGGVLVAMALLRDGSGGLLEAAAVVAAALGAATVPVGGRAPVAWAPVVGRWLLSRLRPAVLAAPGSSAAPAGLRLIRAAPGGGDPIGVVRDRRSGTWAAVIPVASRAFTLLDPADKQRRLAAWGTVLASLTRERSPIHRVQWVERTVPGDRDALVARLDEARSQAPGGCPAAVGSYRELVAAGAAAGSAHEVLLVVSVSPRRCSRQLRAFGGGDDAVCALLQREVRLLTGQLRVAEIDPGPALDLAGLAGALRAGADPARRAARSERSAWPLGWRDTWSAARVDGRWHATYWVAEWPCREVGADFMLPLLLGGGPRTISVTMAPVPPRRAAREAESSRTAEMADDELRRRAGFLQTARHLRRSEGVAQREAELADGHGEVRFAGYVSVSGESPVELDGACAAVESAAQQCGIELRRLYGQQAEAVTWTLPLARGLA